MFSVENEQFSGHLFTLTAHMGFDKCLILGDSAARDGDKSPQQ